MSEKIEDFKFSNWEDYAKTLEAENKKLREDKKKVKQLFSDYQDSEDWTDNEDHNRARKGINELLTQAPPEGGGDG
ncbi:hypothetical protein LCGC14_2406130 [marine sediment metagenome]|uniref:Uncharacterized protein n=2 Tax=marine sediment metagenome TaxID=412755 RepID=A0A0F9E679_9ZZZZ